MKCLRTEKINITKVICNNRCIITNVIKRFQERKVPQTRINKEKLDRRIARLSKVIHFILLSRLKIKWKSETLATGQLAAIVIEVISLHAKIKNYLF